MSDLIDREKAIEHCQKRLYATALNQSLLCEQEMCKSIADERIIAWLNELPSAESEKHTKNDAITRIVEGGTG